MKSIAVFFVLLTLGSSGCAKITKQSFNAEASAHIKTIAVITPAPVEEVMVNIAQHPGYSFGLVGGLAALSDMKAKTSEYNKSLETYKVDWTALSQTKILQTLSNIGFTTEALNIRQKDQEQFLDSYPATNADALLDYYLYPSYSASGTSTNYLPFVNLNIRLVDAKTKAVLYENSLTSDTSNAKEYSNIANLVANAKDSQDELIKALDKVVKKIEQDLKKQPG